METEQTLRLPDSRIKLGVLTSLTYAFENDVGRYKRSLFDYLAEAVNSDDNPVSHMYEFTRIFNLELEYPSLSPYMKLWSDNQRSSVREEDDEDKVSHPTLEQITSHFSDEEKLMSAFDAYDIDSVLFYYCRPFFMSFGFVETLFQKYEKRVLTFNPLNFSYLPTKEISTQEIETIESDKLYQGLLDVAHVPYFIEQLHAGRKNRLAEREAAVRYTIEDVENYLRLR